ncbi:unnamed protein product [Thelazia callipaeda]|uniref:Ovule protein n=1 Tax=Thelazia callipaeda TaxID=103827 RepID=A0A0N5CJI2_THECL|nr:unnamed protein product [Thelazia callipaeda]
MKKKVCGTSVDAPEFHESICAGNAFCNNISTPTPSTRQPLNWELDLSTLMSQSYDLLDVPEPFYDPVITSTAPIVEQMSKTNDNDNDNDIYNYIMVILVVLKVLLT